MKNVRSRETSLGTRRAGDAVLSIGLVAFFALTAGAVDYHFKGTVDDRLDNGANWNPEITDFSALSATADKLFIDNTDSTRKDRKTGSSRRAGRNDGDRALRNT